MEPEYADAVSKGRIEVLVEPFKEGDPGPHVMAVVDALKEAGLTVDMGPFATTAVGDLDTLVELIGQITQAALEAGASSLQTRLERL